MPALWHDAFYRFAHIEDPDRLVTTLAERLRLAGVLGTVLVAEEGINAMLAGSASQLEQARGLFEAEGFFGLRFQRTPCRTKPFKYLKVKRKRELVPLGVPGVNVAHKGAADLSPQEWRELIKRPDIVLIDNRNGFEVELGRFKGAIDPGVQNFNEFAEYARQRLSEWRGKTVAMYCTGGIRCQKAGAWLCEVGLSVYQLDGGILNYFAQIEDADDDFEGECFVFDARFALGSDLHEVDEDAKEALS
jgi:UPF0176 protein